MGTWPVSQFGVRSGLNNPASQPSRGVRSPCSYVLQCRDPAVHIDMGSGVWDASSPLRVWTGHPPGPHPTAHGLGHSHWQRRTHQHLPQDRLARQGGRWSLPPGFAHQPRPRASHPPLSPSLPAAKRDNPVGTRGTAPTVKVQSDQTAWAGHHRLGAGRVDTTCRPATRVCTAQIGKMLRTDADPRSVTSWGRPAGTPGQDQGSASEPTWGRSLRVAPAAPTLAVPRFSDCYRP